MPVAAAIAAIRLGGFGHASSFNQSEADIAALHEMPWVMTGSDASGGHPRVYGSFARKYAKYVVADHVLTLREFIERGSAASPPTGSGSRGRGHLKSPAPSPTWWCSIRIPTLRAPPMSSRPCSPRAMQTVVVDGMVALDKGALTGKAAGRALPHSPTPEAAAEVLRPGSPRRCGSASLGALALGLVFALVWPSGHAGTSSSSAICSSARSACSSRRSCW